MKSEADFIAWLIDRYQVAMPAQARHLILQRARLAEERAKIPEDDPGSPARTSARGPDLSSGKDVE
jgi:hypothetical protein